MSRAIERISTKLAIDYFEVVTNDHAHEVSLKTLAGVNASHFVN